MIVQSIFLVFSLHFLKLPAWGLGGEVALVLLRGVLVQILMFLYIKFPLTSKSFKLMNNIS